MPWHVDGRGEIPVVSATGSEQSGALAREDSQSVVRDGWFGGTAIISGVSVGGEALGSRMVVRDGGVSGGGVFFSGILAGGEVHLCKLAV